jgi:2-keto-4-pentenoate hydratase/2-oxohepta-3-ene-1,7-dioic acid hydratase in catechol pathway
MTWSGLRPDPFHKEIAAVKLLTFEEDGKRKLGLRLDDEVVDLSAADSALPDNMLELIAAGPDALARVKVVGEGSHPRLAVGDLKLCPPIARPGKVICIGLNYADHAAETNHDIPAEPVVFGKFASAITGPFDPVEAPPTSNELDYEAELVAIIGKGGKHIPESDALDHVFGYSVGNDISARDYQVGKPAGQWLLGKTFDTFAPYGPHIVTADEVADPHNLGIRCILNGQTVQDSSTSQFIFDLPRLIAYTSHVFTLEPGDILWTGTPPGVGMGRKPPLWLKPGDTVVVEVDGVGRIENRIV